MKVIDDRKKLMAIDFGKLEYGKTFIRGTVCTESIIYLKIPVFKRDGEYYNSYCFNDELFHSVGCNELVTPTEISIHIESGG